MTGRVMFRPLHVLIAACGGAIDHVVRRCRRQVWSRPSLELLLRDVVLCGIDSGRFRIEIELPRNTLLQQLGMAASNQFDFEIVMVSSASAAEANRVSALFALAIGRQELARFATAVGCDVFFDESHPGHDVVARTARRLRQVFRAMVTARIHRIEAAVDRDAVTAHELIRIETMLEPMDRARGTS